jgi:hypothetical protein
MCRIVAATTDKCAKGWVCFVFEAMVATGQAENSNNGPIDLAGWTPPICDVMGIAADQAVLGQQALSLAESAVA